MPRDVAYIGIIVLLVVMLLISNGRMADQQHTFDQNVMLCETATRILDERLVALRSQIEKAEAA
jgi:uncharacterized membrane protein